MTDQKDHADHFTLITIELRWDKSRRVVVGAKGVFHRSCSPNGVVYLDGLAIPYGEQLDWNALRDQLYGAALERWTGR